MKKAFSLALISLMFAPALARAQSAPDGWDADVRKFDQAYWDAYNQCDVQKLDQMNTDEMEFYHDTGGAMTGKAKFATAMEKNICGNPSRRVRREAMADTVRMFPMMQNGKLYGALIEGNHQFYNYSAGTPEVLSDRARFTLLLLLKDGVWKAARVFSYAHAPVQSEKKLPEVAVAGASLDRLTGNYTAKDKMLLTVKTAGNHLMVLAGGSTFELYPTSENNFAMKERDIKVAFSVDKAGKGQGLVVRERGAIVAEASASAP